MELMDFRFEKTRFLPNYFDLTIFLKFYIFKVKIFLNKILWFIFNAEF